MESISRRELFVQGANGLAVVGASSLLLMEGALPTEASGDLGDYQEVLFQEQEQTRIQVPGNNARVPVMGNARPANFNATEDNILGPYYRAGAPFRAKVTPPLEPGTVLLISGRVWASNTRRPLAHALLDIWQANAQGRYDNDDARRPPARNVFKNRARIITDENGYYEFETVYPGNYQIGRNVWRPAHIHYLVRHPGYRQLVTQLYFQGDRHNRTDEFIKRSLIINLQQQQGPNNTTYKKGVFDVVLAPVPQRRQPRQQGSI